MNLRPLHDRVLVRRVEETESIRNGIIIPDSAKEEGSAGRSGGRRERQASGWRRRAELDVKAGDRILLAIIRARISESRARNI